MTWMKKNNKSKNKKINFIQFYLNCSGGSREHIFEDLKIVAIKENIYMGCSLMCLD